MKIYTKTGDEGSTSLLFGTRVYKDDARLEAYGTLDELNAFVGSLTSVVKEGQVKFLQHIQAALFQLGSLLAAEKESHQLSPLSGSIISELENEMDRLDSFLPALSNFILPGGAEAAIRAHLCRTVSRRAERRVISLGQMVTLPENAVPFLNRLSDYFFVLSRYLNHEEGQEELVWKA